MNKNLAVNQMVALNTKARQHFFDRSTLAFFDSIIESGTDNYGLFLTSEKAPGNNKRMYTVRYFTPDGKVETMSPFYKSTRKQAESFRNKLISKLKAVKGEIIKLYEYQGKIEVYVSDYNDVYDNIPLEDLL